MTKFIRFDLRLSIILHRKAKRKAKEQNRSLTNYITSLIDKDVNGK